MSGKYNGLARKSIIQTATFFWLIALILLIAGTSVLIAERFFMMGERRTEARAEPRGSRGVPRRDFQCCPPIVKKRSLTQRGSPELVNKIHATQPKTTSLWVWNRRLCQNILHFYHVCSFQAKFTFRLRLFNYFRIQKQFPILIHYSKHILFIYINDLSVKIMGITLHFVN